MVWYASILSYKSTVSWLSIYSVFAFCCFGAVNGILSVLSLNSFACALSVNSFFSILSINSVFSIGCNSEGFKICGEYTQGAAVGIAAAAVILITFSMMVLAKTNCQSGDSTAAQSLKHCGEHQ
eukprot:m.96160 g.96160  ORF g.96160 m.96160 type:complete len:124 (+) comp16639_c0_seq1:278-649(+)